VSFDKGEKMTINLGDKVRDKITGFEGIVTGHCSYISGCDQISVQPQMKKGDTDRPTGMWIDIDCCEVIEAEAVPVASVRAPQNIRPGFGDPAPIK
jgi:hypothetical protein